MKNLFKFTSILLSAAFILSAASCSKPSVSGTSAYTETTQVTEPSVEMTTETTVISDEERIEGIISGMSAKDKVCQMMIVSFRKWQDPLPEDNGTDPNRTVENTDVLGDPVNVYELNDEIRACLSENRYGGMILFANNFRDAEQTVRLISDIQTSSVDGSGLPMLIGVDQEGGSITRIGFGTDGVGNMALAATGNPDDARKMAEICADELGLLGIHMNFAPVLDVNNNPSNPVIGIRSFSDDPRTAAEFGCAYVEGMTANNIIATLKHFPGHGNTDTDSHTGFPCIQSTLDELAETELVPFQAAIDGGVRMIMTAHIQYPEIDPATYTSISSGEEVYLPATMSKVILTDVLRERMGFEGIIVSDALDMAAITDNFAPADILTLTVNSGVDMLIMPPVTSAEGYERLKEWTELAVSLAEDGTIDMERVDESVRKILKLKLEQGLLDESDFSVTDEKIAAAVSGVGSQEHRQTAYEIAADAVTVLKNDNDVFPLDIAEDESVFILFADSCASRIETAGLAVEELRDIGVIPDGAGITYMAHTRENDDECLEAADSAGHVILVHRVYDAKCLDPETDDGFSSAIFDEIIERRHEDDRPVILISCQLPYDAARFPDADAILLTYGSSAMRAIPPESGEGSAYMPNLVVALKSCFGYGNPAGVLPIDIPALDSEYKYTDEVMFSR